MGKVIDSAFVNHVVSPSPATIRLPSVPSPLILGVRERRHWVVILWEVEKQSQVEVPVPNGPKAGTPGNPGHTWEGLPQPHQENPRIFPVSRTLKGASAPSAVKGNVRSEFLPARPNPQIALSYLA